MLFLLLPVFDSFSDEPPQERSCPPFDNRSVIFQKSVNRRHQICVGNPIWQDARLFLLVNHRFPDETLLVCECDLASFFFFCNCKRPHLIFSKISISALKTLFRNGEPPNLRTVRQMHESRGHRAAWADIVTLKSKETCHYLEVLNVFVCGRVCGCARMFQ